jgi:RNA polymerase subunit RPABC4/transcription elongation factor Spt4
MVTDELTCPNCGSTEGPRGTKEARELIELTCDDCGHSWTRVPRQPCPRCGSGDVEPAATKDGPLRTSRKLATTQWLPGITSTRPPSSAVSVGTNGKLAVASSAPRFAASELGIERLGVTK